MNSLILIRGNSGSGKTTVAKKVQERLGKGTMLISQDDIRIRLLNPADAHTASTVDLIYKLAMYGSELGANVIVEGILSNKKYAHMLHKLVSDFDGSVHAYYFDIPFEETVKRHQSKPNKDEFGVEAMKRWWREKDYLGMDNELIFGAKLSSE